MKDLYRQAIMLFATSLIIGLSAYAQEDFKPHFGVYENSNYPSKYYGYYGCENDVYYFVALCGYPFGEEVTELPAVLVAHPKGKDGYKGKTFVVPDKVTYYSYKVDNGVADYNTMSDKPQQAYITGIGNAFQNIEFNSEIENLVLNKHIKHIYKNELYDNWTISTITLASEDKVFFHPYSLSHSSVDIFESLPGVKTSARFEDFTFNERYSRVLFCEDVYHIEFAANCDNSGGMDYLTIPSHAIIEKDAFKNCRIEYLFKIVGQRNPDDGNKTIFEDEIYNDQRLSVRHLMIDYETPPVITKHFITPPSLYPQVSYRQTIVYVPDQSVSLYRNADYWKDYTISEKSKYIDGVNDITEDTTIKSIESYDLYGRRINPTDTKGLIIERITYSDGTTTTTKRLINR